MIRSRLLTLAVLTGTVLFGQLMPESEKQLMKAQRDALARLGFMDGLWRGTGSVNLPSGDKQTLAFIIRCGSFLDGTIKLVEGREYDPDGKVISSTFATIFYNPPLKAYKSHVYAGSSMAEEWKFTPTADGFSRETSRIRFTVVVKGGTWHEVGDMFTPGNSEPIRVFEMNLKRAGDTEWPAAGAVPPK